MDKALQVRCGYFKRVGQEGRVEMTQSDKELKMAEDMRGELTGYCYRMLGVFAEAEDAVQDTLVRVWQGGHHVQNQASLKSWIYRVATNVCLDKLRQAKRRALPMDLSDPAITVIEPKETFEPSAWIGPFPDLAADPAVITMGRESIRLSFIAILQALPPKQRAVIILNDVFQWSAKETAEALDMSTAAVNSALQRARATIKQTQLKSDTLRKIDDDVDERLLASYVKAFEQYDIHALLALFKECASLSMPPFTMWLRGKMDIASFYRATGSHCMGSRLIPVRANGNCPAFAQYMPAGEDGILEPWAIHILEIQEERIAHIHHFIDAKLFDSFRLPTIMRLDR
ncbi:sigma-70 family RNA polymerase sigma factor [Paenibacillus sp. GCM10027627]|uniref:sigma-70 family RNA polymerase sigma factor n=1 Tax=unclassified Paenibacillus TaxID=185978 RepID=UPI0036250295